MIYKSKLISLTLIMAMILSLFTPWKSSIVHANASDSVLLNGGFESGNLINWGFHNQTNTAVKVQNSVKHSGNNSFEAQFNGNSSLHLYNNSAGTAGETYYYEVWVNTEGLTPTNQAASNYPEGSIAAWNNGVFVSNLVYFNILPNQGWVKYSGTFTMPAGSNKIKLNIVRKLSGDLFGKMYVDDVMIAIKPSLLEITANSDNYNMGSTVNLGTQIQLFGTYGGNSLAISPTNAIIWEVVSGEAVIENNFLKYTGMASEGNVVLKAKYAGIEATKSVKFIRDLVAPIVDSIIINGGFESGAFNNWGTHNLTNTTLKVQDSIKRSGSFGLELSMNAEAKFHLYEKVPVFPGETYYYEMWSNSQGVIPNDQATNYYMESMIAAWNDNTYVTNLAYHNIIPVQGWAKHSGSFTIPAGSNALKLNILRKAAGILSGKLYIDDVMIVKIPNSLILAADQANYKVLDSVKLGTQISITGNYVGWPLAIPTPSAVSWEVISGDAVIENDLLKYTGIASGGNVTLKASYAGREATIVVPFIPDTEAPVWSSAAQLLVTEKGRNYIDLTWSGATDDSAVTKYRLTTDLLQPVVVEGVNNYRIMGLEPGTTYHFEVEAGDASGNWSNSKIAADFKTTTLQEPDWNNASLTVTNLVYSALQLNWVGAIDDINVTQYKIYQDGQEIGITQTSNSFPITGLSAETSYTFRIQAGDADGNWTNNGPYLTVITPYRPIAEAMVSVNESSIINKASRDLLGMSHSMNRSQELLTVNPSSTEIRSDYYTFMQGLPMPLNRGGVGQHYLWKNTLGTMSERVGFTNPGFSSDPMNFGIVEWVKSLLDITPDGTVIWGFNMLQPNAAEDAADLAEFLTGDGTNNPNGGVNWAQRRIDLGIANPVKVKFELGNELDWMGAQSWSIDKYISESRQIINAVRLVKPDAQFALFAKTAPWAGGTPPEGVWRDWHNKILQELGNDIDYLSLHPYYLGYSLDYVDKFINYLRDDIAVWKQGTGNLNPTHDIKIYISEHGIWPLRIDTDTYANSSYRTHNLEGALGTAEFISRMYHRPEIAMVTLHAFVAGPWYAINKNSSGLFLSGVGEMMKVMNQALGKNVVKSTVTGVYTDITQNDASFTVNAMSTESDGLNLVIINRDPRMKRDVSFQFEQKYKLVKKTVFTGDSILSDNNTSSPIHLTTETVNDESQFNHIVIPDKSLVVLYLELKDITPPVTTDNAPTNWVNQDIAVNLTATDNVNGSGVAATYYTVDGGLQQSGTTVSITTEGIHTLEYWSEDKASNTETKHTVMVKIDKTAPVSSAVINPAAPNGSNGWYTSNVIVSLAAADNLSSVTSTVYSINNGAWSNYSAPLDFSDGVYKVDFRSTDQAGNIEQSQSILFNVDKTAPSLDVTLDKTVLWPPNGKMVTIHAALTPSDATSGVASVILTSIINNATEEEHEQDHKKDHKKSEDIQADIGTMATSFSLRAEKADHGKERIYTITYTVTDNAGLVSTVISTVRVPANQSDDDDDDNEDDDNDDK